MLLTEQFFVQKALLKEMIRGFTLTMFPMNVMYAVAVQEQSAEFV